MDLTKITFTDHQPYVEAGVGDTVWFDYEGTSYYVEKWSTRHSSGMDIYTLDGDRDANDLVDDDTWSEFLDLIEEFCAQVAKAEEGASIPSRQQDALDSVLKMFNGRSQED